MLKVLSTRQKGWNFFLKRSEKIKNQKKTIRLHSAPAIGDQRAAVGEHLKRAGLPKNIQKGQAHKKYPKRAGPQKNYQKGAMSAKNIQKGQSLTKICQNMTKTMFRTAKNVRNEQVLSKISK